ncbi:MAG: DUF4097 family beta strand repeat-containing protein, partial [Clostridia bacterium]|nr:DUF4097 family beta strand repeat-containing protein [Clostridia bacterium]
MKKRTYLKRLRKALQGVPNREKEKLIEYYDELIDELHERGKTDREIFNELETPAQVATDYFNANEGEYGGIEEPPRRRRRSRPAYDDYDDDYDDYEPPRRRRERRPSRRRERERLTGGKLLLFVLLFPLWLPLVIVAFAIALTAFILGIAFVIALGALTLGFAVSGIYLIVMSFGVISANGSVAMAQIGAGVALIGLSALAAMAVGPTARGFATFTGWVFRGFRRADYVKTRATGKTITKAAFGFALVLVGCGVGALGMGRLDWNWRNLAVVGDMQEHTEEFSLDELTALSVESDNLALSVVRTDGEAKLVYTDCVEVPKNFSFEEGKIELNSDWTNNFWGWVKQSWSHGVLFTAVMSESNQAVLYLPESFTGELAVKTSNGGLEMEGISLESLSLISKNGFISVKDGSFSTIGVQTSNGYVSFDGVTAGSVVAQTSNGFVKLQDVNAEIIDAHTSNGMVKLSRVVGQDIRLKSGNGSVSGSLLGMRDDYRI